MEWIKERAFDQKYEEWKTLELGSELQFQDQERDLCPPLSNPGQVEVELVVLLKLPLQIFTLARAPPTSCTCYTSTAIVGLGNQAQK